MVHVPISESRNCSNPRIDRTLSGWLETLQVQCNDCGRCITFHEFPQEEEGRCRGDLFRGFTICRCGQQLAAVVDQYVPPTAEEPGLL